MLDSFPVLLLISSALGFLSGIGVGGGSLLILWLTVVMQMDYPQAKLINLLFFLPAAAVSSFFRWKQGSLVLKKVIPGILAGCAAAAVCTWVGAQLDTGLLKKLFGALLLITGIREVFYKPKKETGQK